jgi:hypothetical protein
MSLLMATSKKGTHNRRVITTNMCTFLFINQIFEARKYVPFVPPYAPLVMHRLFVPYALVGVTDSASTR